MKVPGRCPQCGHGSFRHYDTGDGLHHCHECELLPSHARPASTHSTRRPLWIVVIIVALVIAVAVVRAHNASNSPGDIPATVKGASYAAVASDVACAPQSGVVRVTGTLTGNANVPAYSGVSATIYDSAGSQIGSSEGPLLALNNGQSQPFHITVVVSGGAPASCFVTWGAGPPPG